MQINDLPAVNPPQKRFKDPMIVVGGPRNDPERDEVFKSISCADSHRPKLLMSVNHSHENVNQGYWWTYHVCNESADPTKFDIPEEAYSIGLYCGQQRHPRIDQTIKLSHRQGGAGLLACIAAVYLGYSPVLTVGIYCDEEPYADMRRTWLIWEPYLKGHLFSLTERGIVNELFGRYDGTD